MKGPSLTASLFFDRFGSGYSVWSQALHRSEVDGRQQPCLLHPLHRPLLPRQRCLMRTLGRCFHPWRARLRMRRRSRKRRRLSLRTRGRRLSSPPESAHLLFLELKVGPVLNELISYVLIFVSAIRIIWFFNPRRILIDCRQRPKKAVHSRATLHPNFITNM